MTTARDIVNAALRRANVVGTDETPSAAEAAETLERLNDYMASWSKRGWLVTLADEETAYTHTALSLSDDWPLDGAHVFGMKAIIAMMICEDYGSPIPPGLAAQSKTGVQTLQNDFRNVPVTTMPTLFLRDQRRC